MYQAQRIWEHSKSSKKKHRVHECDESKLFSRKHKNTNHSVGVFFRENQVLTSIPDINSVFFTRSHDTCGLSTFSMGELPLAKHISIRL